MKKSASVFVAGHTGLVGSAILRKLHSTGHTNIITRTHSELDLVDQRQVRSFFNEHRPEYVFLAAARVGGILENQRYPAEFLYQNLMIASNVIHQSYVSGVRKLLYLGSSCIYPRLSEQPMREEFLLTGELEPTNEPYAISKIAGIKLCDSYRRQYGCDFVSAMPSNIYGPHDNFDYESSHVLAALIRKVHQAVTLGSPSVRVWGTGTPRREFLHSDDLAEALLLLMEVYSDLGPINIGSGTDLSIKDLAEAIGRVIGFDGEYEFDISKPDGAPRKLLDISRIRELGWHPRISLEDGIKSTYSWFLNHSSEL